MKCGTLSFYNKEALLPLPTFIFHSSSFIRFFLILSPSSFTLLLWLKKKILFEALVYLIRP